MSNLEKLAIAATIACIVKFLVEGISFFAFGHQVSFGHTDSLTYTALLSPLWGGHAYMNKSKKVDNPDV